MLNFGIWYLAFSFKLGTYRQIVWIHVYIFLVTSKRAFPHFTHKHCWRFSARTETSYKCLRASLRFRSWINEISKSILCYNIRVDLKERLANVSFSTSVCVRMSVVPYFSNSQGKKTYGRGDLAQLQLYILNIIYDGIIAFSIEVKLSGIMYENRGIQSQSFLRI